MESQGPQRWHSWFTNDLLVLLYDCFRCRASKEIEVKYTTNHPADNHRQTKVQGSTLKSNTQLPTVIARVVPTKDSLLQILWQIHFIACTLLLAFTDWQASAGSSQLSKRRTSAQLFEYFIVALLL